MNQRFGLVAAGVIAALLYSTFDAPGATGAAKLKLLIVTGENNHDWGATTPVLKNTLEQTGRFDVTVLEDPAAPVLNDSDLSQYDVVLLNYNGPRWKPEREKALVDYVRGGRGLVIAHAANNAFPDWQEFNEMIGIGWREEASHGTFHAFPVEIIDRQHPITRGMPPQVDHAADELYHHLTGPMLDDEPPPHTKYHMLARAFSSKETGGTGEYEPMALTIEYYEGRVFHTPMGHAVGSMQDACFRAFLTRGSEWAATGIVTIPLPEELAQDEP